jgi:hypothetical protein
MPAAFVKELQVVGVKKMPQAFQAAKRPVVAEDGLVVVKKRGFERGEEQYNAGDQKQSGEKELVSCG